MPPGGVDGVYALETVPDELKGGAVAIGNFDGVHLGHQAVLAAAAQGAKPVLVLTFEPHPRQFFSSQPLFRITTPPQKAAAVRALGCAGVVALPFDAALAREPAEDFVDRVVVDGLKPRHVAVGHDFHFGAARGGNAERLTEWGEAKGFSTTTVSAVAADDGSVISSTRIRRALGEGDLPLAGALLGYRYNVTGPVLHGQKRGRQMNYPTANQALDPTNGLRQGVYAVRVKVDGARYGGVASFGSRPTFDNGAPLLETHVFDYSGDLYGQTLSVTFVSFLRANTKFDGLDALKAQLDKDSADARTALTTVTPLSALDAALNF